MGSKARLAKYIAPIIQSYITDKTAGYLEPFVGGANMIQHIKHSKRYGSDINKYLIALLQYSQDLSNTLPETISEDEYNRVKNNKDYYPDWYVGLVGFCSSYGVKFFGGYARDNRQYDVIASRIRALEKDREKFKEISFRCFSFYDIKPVNNFVIYCDPPYKNTASYARYFINHDYFWQWVRQFSKNNVVLISELNAPDDFEILWEGTRKTTLGNGEKAANVTAIERLFKWKD